MLFLCFTLSTGLLYSQVSLKEKVAVYIQEFNNADNESVINLIPNSQASDWIEEQVPLFECPDSAIEKTYYFRWWSFRKHLKNTPDGTIVTEFIEPVKHAGKYNSISCALGHHIYEGRWLKDYSFLKEYVDFWFYHADEGESKPRFHQFSSWLADALLAYAKVTSDTAYVKSRLELLVKDYEKWEAERLLSNGLFWQHDVKDGMEESVSGGRREKNQRPTINSYMYGNAKAIAEIAALSGNKNIENLYLNKAEIIRQHVLDSLWDDDGAFFKTRLEEGQLHQAREAIGFIPWYFNLPPDQAKYSGAWTQLFDTLGFNATWGLTTAERREPTFRTRGSGHGCEWDGAIWPFASTQTLRAAANFLSHYQATPALTKEQFYDQVRKYATSHVMNNHSYIGEYQDETNGAWLKGDHPRSKFYNHSTYADVIIQDLIGFKPELNGGFTLVPLIPEKEWAYFALTDLHYHGKNIAIFWDETGKRYGKGKGLTVYVDGQKVAKSKKIKSINLNQIRDEV